MADVPTTTLLVGLAVVLARAVEWLARSVYLSSRKPRNGNGARYPTSGEQSVDFWRLTMQEVVKESIEEAFKGRNETVRQIIREELRDGRHK